MPVHQRSNMARGCIVFGALTSLVTLTACDFVRPRPCQDEAAVRALAHAYVLALPLFEAPSFLKIATETLRVFVPQQAAYFRQDGESIRCARALSRAIIGRIVDIYDPRDTQSAAEVAMRTGLPDFADKVARDMQAPLSEMVHLAVELQWLSDVLPPMVNGDTVPYKTTGSIFRQQLRQAIPFLEIEIAAMAWMERDFSRMLWSTTLPYMGMSLQAAERAIVQLAHTLPMT